MVAGRVLVLDDVAGVALGGGAQHLRAAREARLVAQVRRAALQSALQAAAAARVAGRHRRPAQAGRDGGGPAVQDAAGRRVHLRRAVAAQNLHFRHLVAAQSETGIASPVRRRIHYSEAAPSTALSLQPNIIQTRSPANDHQIRAFHDEKVRQKLKRATVIREFVLEA